jgi:imidazolonepropionase-like amidohydrolase
MTVVITGRRITAVGHEGTVESPKGATSIDGRSRFLIPGLWDMHVHLSIITESSLEAFIANGVTGVRDMGGDLDQIDGWRKEIAAGVRIGPRIVRAGPLVDGPKKTAMYRLTVTNAVEAQHAVDSLQQRGVDFIKVHNRVPRDAYFALADECRKTGMRFVGHIPRGVSARKQRRRGSAASSTPRHSSRRRPISRDPR